MPVARVRKNNRYINSSSLHNLSIALKHAIAKALNVPGCPEGLLAASDVEVYFEDFQKFDKHSKDVEITIEANFLSQREENLEARTKLIADEVRRWLPHILFFIWVRLAPGAYIEG